MEDQERYQIVKKEMKRVIAKAIDKEAKEQLRKFVEMPLSERMREIFKMTKAKARDKQDVAGVKCVKNREGELKVLLKDRLDVWKEYAEDLLNRENEWQNDLVSDANEGPVVKVDVVEVK